MKKKQSVVGKIATAIFILGFVFVGVTSGLMYKIEVIPNNAKIFVYPLKHKWTPDAFFITRDFNEQLADPKRAESAKRWLAEQTPAVYADVQKGGKYEGFDTFPVLFEEPGNIRRGWHGSLLLSWFLRRPRWNPDGSWNW